jgi:hypothetical protein
MRTSGVFALVVAGAALVSAAPGDEPLPWQVNKPLCKVEKSLFRKRPANGGAANYWVGYIGPKLERMEISSVERRDDIAEEIKQRFSEDNGRTWSPYQPLPPQLSYPKGVEIADSNNTWEYDPRSGANLQMYLRQVSFEGKPISYLGVHNFTYYRFTFDRGKTWSPLKQLRYEEGEDFDPKDPLKPAFLKRNQGYTGNNLLFHSNGTVIFGLAHTNAPGDPDNDKRGWKMGSVLMIGKWDTKARDYLWEAGQRVETNPDISGRGLMEPGLAELTDGRVLVVWRAAPGRRTPGHKYFSVSRDGGRTLAPVREWKYDDGSAFYSPSSIHQFHRHGVTKKLYWIGNICAKPPAGNNPRYPLIIAEVDEALAALKKKTVTVIDDRQPGQSEKVAFSSFTVLEDRENHKLELYLAVYGEDAKKPADADVYRYVVTLQQ